MAGHAPAFPGWAGTTPGERARALLRFADLIKESGYGKDLSMYSLEDYTRIKHVTVSLG